MRWKKKRYISIRSRKNKKNTRNIILVTVMLLVVLICTMAVVAQIPKAKTVVMQEKFNTYTKWYFSRDECRYIFPEGSCQVAVNNCDSNTYDYVPKRLNVNSDCIEGTVVLNANNQPAIKRYVKTTSNCEFKATEGEKVNLKPAGYDPDPEIGPAGKLIWTFYKPFDIRGEWQTKKGDAGITKSKLKLSDGELYDEVEFCIEVLKSNNAPVLQKLSDVTKREGDLFKLEPKCTDPDGDKVTIRTVGFTTIAEKRLGYNDAGKYKIMVVCTDPDGESDSDTFTLTVLDTNRAPDLTVASVGVEEEKIVSIKAKVSDSDGDNVTITYGKPFDSQGEWKTRFGDKGVHDVEVTASDGKTKTVKTIKVTVTRINKAPVVKPISDVIVKEGETVTVVPDASDPNGDEVSIKWSGWMSSNTKKTDYDDAGTYTVTVTVSDGKLEAKETFKVTVLNYNRPPVITKIK